MDKRNQKRTNPDYGMLLPILSVCDDEGKGGGELLRLMWHPDKEPKAVIFRFLFSDTFGAGIGCRCHFFHTVSGSRTTATWGLFIIGSSGCQAANTV